MSCGCGTKKSNTSGGGATGRPNRFDDGVQFSDFFGSGERLGIVEAIQLMASLATLILLFRTLNK